LFIEAGHPQTKIRSCCFKDMKLWGIIACIGIITALDLPAQTIGKIDAEQLVSLTTRSDDTTYVINFWATWCSPCVKEIANFEKVHQEYQNEKLKVILVSLDFPNQLEKRVIPFLREKGISASVNIMTDTDYNAWIDRVDPSWSGAIPATLIYQGNRRVFLEKELTYTELMNNVHQIQP
jgi:thiol-disulfide isomerase/thioredoxin